MSTEENNQAAVEAPQAPQEKETNTESVDYSAELAKSNETIGSLKRELKDLKKSLRETQETQQETPQSNPELSSLQERLDKQTLRAAEITHEDDVELAKKTAEKWNMSLDDLVADDDFMAKLEKQQTKRANAEATSGVKGEGAQGTAKQTAEYWIAKGQPPTRADVPDRKTRAAIVRQFISSQKSSKTFYND